MYLEKVVRSVHSLDDCSVLASDQSVQKRLYPTKRMQLDPCEKSICEMALFHIFGMDWNRRHSRWFSKYSSSFLKILREKTGVLNGVWLLSTFSAGMVVFFSLYAAGSTLIVW